MFRRVQHVFNLVLSKYSASLDSNPVVTKGTSAFIILSVADVCRQLIEITAAPDDHHDSSDSTGKHGVASTTIENPSYHPVHHLHHPTNPSLPEQLTYSLEFAAETLFFSDSLSTAATASPSKLDLMRTMRLSVFYATVHAPWVHFWFGVLDKRFGKATSLRTVAVKVAIDQFGATPIFLANMMTVQSILAGYGVKESVNRMNKNYKECLQGTWMTWIPALMFNFAFVPAKFRVLFINVIQVGFGVFVSKMVNNIPEEDNNMIQQAA